MKNAALRVVSWASRATDENLRLISRSTNRHSACGSRKRRINEHVAVRLTRTFVRVTHFMRPQV